jgi:hypothetical protein
VWEVTVRTDQSVTVTAPLEAAWSLLRSPQAWSARPRSCLTFDLADPLGPTRSGEEPGRLRFYLTAGDTSVYPAILEVTAETPGQQLCLQTAGGRATWALSVEPGRRGTNMRIAASWTVNRSAKIDAEAGLRRELKGWLAALRDIADGHRPPPGDGMPEALRQACLASPPPGPAAEACASVEVGVAVETVRGFLGTTELARTLQPASVLYVGQVPGTPPAGNVGAMRFYVHRRPDGLHAGRVSLLAAISPGGLVVRFVTAPYEELTIRYEPAGPSTRLELSRRLPGRAAQTGEHRDQHVRLVTAVAQRYKDAIERLAGRRLAAAGGTQVLGHRRAKASFRMEIPSSSSVWLITSGGRNRSTLPYVPQVRVIIPSAWQVLATFAAAAASGSSVPGLTSSIASIAPRPRTSPITG